jgi:cytochrome c2
MTLYILFATFATVFGSAHAAFGFQFALFGVLSMLLSAMVFLYARHHLAIVTLVVFLTAIMAAAKLDPNLKIDAKAPVGALAAAVAVEESRAQLAGETLFQELGCIACHRPDGTGVGPSLTGVFGRPLADAGCGALTVNEEYVRESILNPSAIVAPGFAPVMPTFAGRVTEEQLRALIAYVKSLSVPVQAPRPEIDGLSAAERR